MRWPRVTGGRGQGLLSRGAPSALLFGGHDSTPSTLTAGPGGMADGTSTLAPCGHLQLGVGSQACAARHSWGPSSLGCPLRWRQLGFLETARGRSGGEGSAGVWRQRTARQREQAGLRGCWSSRGPQPQPSVWSRPRGTSRLW